jgi:hypothetical protein
VPELISGGGRCYFALMAEHTFRLKNTPQDTLLVKFYRVVPYSAENLERQVVSEILLATGMGGTTAFKASRALYQGPVLQNPVLIEAIAKLATRCTQCNCVRIEPMP